MNMNKFSETDVSLIGPVGKKGDSAWFRVSATWLEASHANRKFRSPRLGEDACDHFGGCEAQVSRGRAAYG